MTGIKHPADQGVAMKKPPALYSSSRAIQFRQMTQTGLGAACGSGNLRSVAKKSSCDPNVAYWPDFVEEVI